MAKPDLLQFDLQLSPDLAEISRDLYDELQPAIISAHEDTLADIEALQVKRYTQSGNPPKPVGSRYRRTFKTRKKSRTQLLRRQLPVITSRWEVKAKWASYVMGLRRQQARIHRNRWKSLEVISEATETLYNERLDKRLDEIQI